jgi:predicted nucleotidyltransferase
MDSDTSLHLRDLARQSGLAIGTIQAEVSNLKKAGLLIENRDGNRLYFKADVNNPVFADLQSIIMKTTGLREQLVDALESIQGIRYAFVYGSFANNEATSDSDIDLFVIGSTGLRQLASPLRKLSQSLSREINPVTYTKSSYIEKLHNGDAFINEVAKSKKIWIIGSEDDFAKLA